jgi:hypothetical protein
MKTTFVDRKKATLYKYEVEFRNKTYSVEYFTDGSGKCVKVDILNDWGVSQLEVEDEDVISEIFNAVKYEVDIFNC